MKSWVPWISNVIKLVDFYVKCKEDFFETLLTFKDKMMFASWRGSIDGRSWIPSRLLQFPIFLVLLILWICESFSSFFSLLARFLPLSKARWVLSKILLSSAWSLIIAFYRGKLRKNANVNHAKLSKINRFMHFLNYCPVCNICSFLMNYFWKKVAS